MNAEFKRWTQGRGVIQHQQTTTDRIATLLKNTEQYGLCDSNTALDLFEAADVLCNMGMWLTAHMTYAQNVYLDGREMQATDFKKHPEGHTGGALNMVPAYVGYLLANALSGHTRAWLMGQGHSVAAIDSVNILLGNLEREQHQRYPLSDSGLSTLCQDFYSYTIAGTGRPEAPLGSHVNVFTAGGISEGGYLGFAELQYVHMPLPGQELVTFLSDGAFEEQRGSDWAPRWWRGEDTGNVMPIMIANGRRIDQRTTMAQTGGVEWFQRHLELNGFDPVLIDGSDPAAHAWAILTMSDSLTGQYAAIKSGAARYPVKLPYAIAETVKGFGFPGAGTNAAHNLPLAENPASNVTAREQFNTGAAGLFCKQELLANAIKVFSNHKSQSRPQEKNHYLRNLTIEPVNLVPASDLPLAQHASPMEAIDAWFCDFIQANPERRFRVGNPDEMRSNRLNKTLDTLKHRVTEPEPGIAESLSGGVLTALNEEAVISGVLANKQGLNLAVSYEAFAVKMLGAMRQELLFARNLKELGREVRWPGLPVIVSSHTWENGKNEHSHQDPTLAEAWMGEMSDMAPVLFPIDAVTATATLAAVYPRCGAIAVAVVPKTQLPVLCTAAQAKEAVDQGAIVLREEPQAVLQLIAIGAYQLHAVLRAATRLTDRGIPCSVVALLEPGRFRQARDEAEQAYVHASADIPSIVPFCQRRIVVCHTHFEVIAGVLRQLDTGVGSAEFMGYRNRGGTLDVFGMQYANQQTWAHIVATGVAGLDKVNLGDVLDTDEIAALNGTVSPNLLR